MDKFQILIKDCLILNPEFEIEGPLSVIINNGKIHKILKTQEIKKEWTFEETINGNHKLLMPGLSDGHTHCCQQLLRGRVSDEYPMVWTRFLVPFESNLTPEDTYISTQLACLEMIKFGTTAFADSGGVHMDMAAEAVIQSGMRANIAKSTMDMGTVVNKNMQQTTEEAIDSTIDLYKKYHQKGDGRINIWFALRQVMCCSPELVREVAKCAQDYDTKIHAHLCEHKDEVSFCLQNYKRRPAEFLYDNGALSNRLLTAHNVVLSDSDIKLMAENNVNIIHCPRANLANHGFPKTPQILQAGLTVGLGCDGAAPSSLNLFDDIKVLRYAMIAYWGLPSFNPVVMPCKSLLKMATSDGAKALGFNDAGEIKEGYKADLILLDIDQPHLNPSLNLVNTLVEAADGRDVTDSIINGKIIMKNRQVLTLDEEKIIREAKIHADEIRKRAGI